MKNVFLFLAMFASASFVCSAQNDSILKSRMDQIVKKMVNENYKPYSLIKELQVEDVPVLFIPLLEEYKTIKNSIVQESIYQCYFEYALNSNNLSFKRQMVNNLLESCSDSLEMSYACTYSINCALKFDNNCFDRKANDVIERRVRNKNRFSIDFAILSGKLYQPNMIPYLQNQLKEVTDISTVFKLNLVLARLGDKKSIKTVADSLKKMDIENRLINHTEVFKYVKQKEIIDIVINDLETKETEPVYYEPWMSNKDAKGFPLSKRALDILTETIRNFPVPKREILLYTNADLVEAKKWAKNNRNNYQLK